MAKFYIAEKICNLVAKNANEVAIFYSGGKDSICLLDICAPYFSKIYLVNMYFVAGLNHINKYVDYSCKKYKNVTPIFKEHWQMSYVKNSGLYCLPNFDVKLKELSDIDNEIRQETGVNYTFYGMKKNDSLNRNLMLSGYENYISPKNKVYPLAPFSNKDILAYIRMKRLPLPITYSKNKASQGMIFNEDVFLYLRKHYPDDLHKIYKEYPLSQKILFEYDSKIKQTRKI